MTSPRPGRIPIRPTVQPPQRLDERLDGRLDDIGETAPIRPTVQPLTQARTHVQARAGGRQGAPAPAGAHARDQVGRLDGWTEVGRLDDGEKKTGGLREAMPATAEIVDDLRRELGAEIVDRALAAGVKAQKRYAAWLAGHGEDAAQRWLEAQRFEGGSFWASEGGRTVGVKRS